MYLLNPKTNKTINLLKPKTRKGDWGKPQPKKVLIPVLLVRIVSMSLSKFLQFYSFGPVNEIFLLSVDTDNVHVYVICIGEIFKFSRLLFKSYYFL